LKNGVLNVISLRFTYTFI